jgi:hypothetical protein
MSTTANDLEGRRFALEAKMKEVYAQAGDDLDFSKVSILGDGDTKAKIEQFNQLDTELGDVVKAHEAHLKAVERRDEFEAGQQTDRSGRALAGRAGQATPDEDEGPLLSIGEMFVRSAAYTNGAPRGSGDGPVGVAKLPKRVSDIRATLFQTTAGWATESLRSGVVVPFAVRPLGVADLFPLVRTTQAAYVYMEETTFTNNAAEAAEAGTYAESALALTQRSVPVQKVATFIPVTDEQLEDVDGIQSYLDQRLGYMIRARVDSQLLVGDGTPPNIRGVNNAANIQTQALGADVTPDAVYKAMTLVRVTGRANPSGIVMHPNDWQDIKLLRSSDGIYIWGHPADNNPDRIWGVQVVITDAQTQNTAIVGDFAGYSLLVLRRDLEIQVSNSHSTFFIEGKQAVRADLRLAAVYLRGTAFCKVTGI